MSTARALLGGRGARTLARWAIGILIVVALVVSLDASAIWARLAAANLMLVVIGVAGLSSLHLVGAVTWRELTRRLVGLTLGWWQSVRLYYAAQALGGFTPANLGSDAYRVIALRGAGGAARSVVVPIVVQRATSYLAVSLLGACALLVVSRPAGFTAGLVVGALALSGAALGVVSLVWLGPGPLRPLRDRLLGFWDYETPRAEPNRGRFVGAVGIGLGLAFFLHLAGIGLTWLLILGVDPGAASIAALAAVAMARVSLLIPLTPSGLGVQEAALAVLFVGIGLPAESALAGSLLARLSLVLTAILGAMALAVGTGPDRRSAAACGLALTRRCPHSTGRGARR